MAAGWWVVITVPLGAGIPLGTVLGLWANGRNPFRKQSWLDLIGRI